jgi:hypothetical protein
MTPKEHFKRATVFATSGKALSAIAEKQSDERAALAVRNLAVGFFNRAVYETACALKELAKASTFSPQ